MLKVAKVDVVEGVEGTAVDIKEGDDRVEGQEKGNNYFAATLRTAGDMTREEFDIGYDNGALFLPCGATDAFAIRDMHTGKRTLEGT